MSRSLTQDACAILAMARGVRASPTARLPAMTAYPRPADEPPARPRPGGRSARVRAAVLDATIALLREEGDAFGIPQVAARAGVHETSIYRRWGSREALIVEAVRAHIGEEVP